MEKCSFKLVSALEHARNPLQHQGFYDQGVLSRYINMKRIPLKVENLKNHTFRVTISGIRSPPEEQCTAPLTKFTPNKERTTGAYPLFSKLAYSYKKAFIFKSLQGATYYLPWYVSKIFFLVCFILLQNH